MKRKHVPTAREKSFHHSFVCTPRQGKRMAEGKLESSPDDYQQPIFDGSKRRAIEDRNIEKEVEKLDDALGWYGL